MIPFRNDYLIEKIITEQASKEQIFFRKMFGAKIEKSDAAAFLERILDHKWYVSERLGRDIGITVAALDFVINIEPLPVKKLNRKTSIGSGLQKTVRLSLTA